MFKNMKLTKKITILMSIIVALFMVLLFIIISNNTSNMMEKSAIDSMITMIESKEQLIEEFISNSEDMLIAFSKSSDIKKLLASPNNNNIFRYTQNYTDEYYSLLDNWEGLYVAEWDTHVIAHSNPNVVGITTI